MFLYGFVMWCGRGYNIFRQVRPELERLSDFPSELRLGETRRRPISLSLALNSDVRSIAALGIYIHAFLMLAASSMFDGAPVKHTKQIGAHLLEFLWTLGRKVLRCGWCGHLSGA